jgi:regulator of replication initiation timing
VIHDQSGRINGIRYEELAPMLLNEVQQQHQQLMQQQKTLGEVGQLKQQMAELKQANESMRMANETLRASIAKLLTKDERVASR